MFFSLVEALPRYISQHRKAHSNTKTKAQRHRLQVGEKEQFLDNISFDAHSELASFVTVFRLDSDESRLKTAGKAANSELTWKTPK